MNPGQLGILHNLNCLYFVNIPNRQTLMNFVNYYKFTKGSELYSMFALVSILILVVIVIAILALILAIEEPMRVRAARATVRVDRRRQR